MPVLGRWLAPDPLADAYPGHSPYNYAMNNPTGLTDPTGLGPCDLQRLGPASFGYPAGCVEVHARRPLSAYWTSGPYLGWNADYDANVGGGFATREGRDFAGSPTGPQNTFGGRSDWKDGRRDERDGGGDQIDRKELAGYGASLFGAYGQGIVWDAEATLRTARKMSRWRLSRYTNKLGGYLGKGLGGGVKYLGTGVAVTLTGVETYQDVSAGRYKEGVADVGGMAAGLYTGSQVGTTLLPSTGPYVAAGGALLAGTAATFFGKSAIMSIPSNLSPPPDRYPHIGRPPSIP